MAGLRFLLRRFRALLHPQRVHDEIAEELSFHIDRRTEDNIRSGMPPEQAKQEAEKRFGRLTGIREQGYEVRGGRWIESFLQDAAYGLRVLRRNPVFTLTAVVTLALGIGLNTALFAILEGILLRPLPFDNPEQLFMVREKTGPESAMMRLSGPDFDDIHDQSRSFEKVSEILSYFTYTLTGEGEPRNVKCTAINADFFPMLGVHPLMGRLYTPEEYHIDGGNLVISYRFWKQQLGGDPHVIGRNLTMQGVSMPVIGVMPDLPDLYPETDVWAKIVPELEFMHWRQNKFLSVAGRLRPGVSRPQAEQELTALLRRASGQQADLAVTLSPLKDEVTGKVSTQLKIAMGAVLVLLLITCVNVMGLLLARVSERGVEVATRLSLGARPVRILRQFITENLLLVSMGSSLGLALAAVLIRMVRILNPGNLPRTTQVGLDGRVLGLTLLVTLILSMALAWGPASMFSRMSLNAMLKTGRAEARRPRSYRLLVISEIGCALMLLVAAGLLLRSLWRVEHVDPGFRSEHVLTTYLRTTHYSAEGGPFFNEILDRVANTPGVRAAAVADCLPASRAASARLQFDDRPNDPDRPVFADGCWTSASFFTTMGTSLEKGRLFTAGDNSTSPAVVIVNETLAREFWPGGNPIGKRIAVDYTGPGRRSTATARFREVVGVVADMKLRALDVPVHPALYMPFHQDETNHVYSGMNLFVQTAGEPVWLADTVRKQIHAFKPEQTVGNITTMDDVLAAGFSQRRFSVALLGSFAALALLLAAVGLYGAIAFSVSRRTREMGLRIALGATPRNLLALIVREALALAGIGVAAGLVLSLMCARVMTSLLFNVSAFDPLTFAVVGVLLILVAALASFAPARKAAFADPMDALRAE